AGTCRSSDLFFSSRRRHTRFSRDWSSDVCSSDLFMNGNTLKGLREQIEEVSALAKEAGRKVKFAVNAFVIARSTREEAEAELRRIGRAACRERGLTAGGGGCGEEKRRGGAQ